MWHRLMYQLKVINYLMNLSGKQSISNQINGTEERLEIDNLLIFLKEIVQFNRENKVLFYFLNLWCLKMDTQWEKNYSSLTPHTRMN